MKQKMTTQKLAQMAMLVAMATAVHWLESMMMPIFPGLPGVKLGLANLFTLYALQTLGASAAWTIAILRCGLGLLLIGAPVGAIYAFAGAMISCLVMVVLKTLKFGPLAQSVMGALAHNTAQGMMAMVMTGTRGLIYYFPILWLAAVPTGLFVGLVCIAMQKAMKGKKDDRG